jgi:hypothetical protein
VRVGRAHEARHAPARDDAVLVQAGQAEDVDDGKGGEEGEVEREEGGLEDVADRRAEERERVQEEERGAGRGEDGGARALGLAINWDEMNEMP